MANRFVHIQTAFTAGELTSRLAGRLDLNRYYAGAEIIENGLVPPQGGVVRRPGTSHQGEVESAQVDANNRLVPFEFSTEETMILELTPLQVRFYLRDPSTGTSKLLTTNSVGATITNGTFDSNINGWNDLSDAGSSIAHAVSLGGTLAFQSDGSGDAIAHQSVAISAGDENTLHTLRFDFSEVNSITDEQVRVEIGSTQGDNDLYNSDFLLLGTHTILFDPDGNSTVHLHFIFRSDVSSTNRPGLLDNVEILDGVPLDLTTPWTSADLETIKWTQSADILYLATGEIAPRELQRRDARGEFSLVRHDNREGPFLDENTTPTLLSVADASGLTTINANTDLFASTDRGRHVRIINEDGDWAWLQIIEFVGAGQVSAFYRRGSAGTSASNISNKTRWRLGAWSDTTGWPQTNIFHKNRLVWGATETQPQTVWMSTVEGFKSHEPSDPDGTVPDDAGINVTIASDRVNAIRWFSSTDQGLLIGTSGSEVILQRPQLTAGLSPTNVEVVTQSVRGSIPNALPAKIGRSTLFVQRDAEVMRDAFFSFEQSGFDERDITIFAEHLFRGGIKRIVYQQFPFSTLWAVTRAGNLRSLTFQREQQVLAWQRHNLGGTVLDAAVIPETREEQLWLLVERTINSTTVQHIEKLSTIFEDGDNLDNAFFVDDGITQVAMGGTTTVIGLDHLEGEEVSILADGGTHAPKTVSSGQITLDRSTVTAHVGLPQTFKIRTLPFDIVQFSETTTGEIRRLYEATVRFLATRGLRVGPIGNLQPLDYGSESSDLRTSSLATKTGLMNRRPPTSYTDLAQIEIDNPWPLPTHILSIISALEYHDLR